MGAVSSRPDEPSLLYLRDQSRFSISVVTITNARNHTLYRIVPNLFPATSYNVSRDVGDDTPVEYVQDTDSTNSASPSFLMRLSNQDELTFNFTFVVRQADPSTTALPAGTASLDTQIAGLTYIFGSTAKEVENLVVKEFQFDPNLHKNPNVELVGDYNTDGSQSVQFHWSWKWRPAKLSEDRGGGWRNTCSFVEYDQRAHRLNTLATFNFWVHNAQRSLAPNSPRIDLTLPSRLRVPSNQSIESRVSNVSDSEGEGSYKDYKEPQSPIFETIPENGLRLAPTPSPAAIAMIPGSTVKVDVATCKPGEDPTANEDGPVFRATMRSLELKTGNMRLRMKKVLRTAEAAESAQRECNQAVSDFAEALKEAATSNANAVRPALEHYFDKIAKQILQYERENTVNLQKLIIDPISRLYNIEIKAADFKKREFDEESKEYYAYVSKYLGQRSESLKEKKQKQSDEKYQAKRRTFELKRFDYSSFMHDLHGGRKDQEVLSQLTKYADAQTRSYLATAKKVEEMVPQLDALIAEVRAADQDFQLQRTEREEKRRTLEKTAKVISEDGTSMPNSLSHTPSISGTTLRPSESDHSRTPSHGAAGSISYSQSPPSTATLGQPISNGMLGTPGISNSSLSTSPGSKFKGIRDLEDSGGVVSNGTQRKEGLLWALSRPGLHVDPKGITKPGWHKFWIVLDQGKLSEYVNWKERLGLHMDPIDLRVASVREARNSDRRFCFEVITPQYTRVYQAPSEEDMKAWIAAINNALQGAFEARGSSQPAMPTIPLHRESSTRKDIAAVLTGKSSSFSGHRQISNPNRNEANKAVNRHLTVGDKPGYKRSEAGDAETSALLQRIRSADEGNKLCADCGTDNKVDWCSINLGILLCIECSGIHRSLGTHISKVRSLTLDTSVFTQDMVELLLLVGNRVSNMIWEAKLDRFLKPSPHSTREQRLAFITSKYSERMYVQANNLGTQSSDDLLLTSIRRNDIQNVLHALALKANPNSHDRSRSTHALFLALAAADPASPGGTLNFSPNPSISNLNKSVANGNSPVSSTSPAARKAFPVAELLLQNGADIPTEPSPFPLSNSARLYIEFKNEQKLGRPQPSAGPKDNDGDSLSALPSFMGGGGGGGSNDRPKERERLLKRNSGGRPSRTSLASDALESFVKKPCRNVRERSHELKRKMLGGIDGSYELSLGHDGTGMDDEDDNGLRTQGSHPLRRLWTSSMPCLRSSTSNSTAIGFLKEYARERVRRQRADTAPGRLEEN